MRKRFTRSKKVEVVSIKRAESDSESDALAELIFKSKIDNGKKLKLLQAILV